MDEYDFMLSICNKEIEKYRKKAQLNMLFEEMTELQNAICKYKKGEATAEQTAEEIAYLSNMLVQTLMISDCQELYEKYPDEKIDKLSEKLNIDE